MEKRYQFQRPSRAALLDELVAAGFTPLTLAGTTRVETGDTATYVTVAEEDYDKAATVVAAHNAAAVDAAAAQGQARRRQVRQAILAFPDIATPTAAQVTAAVKALCLAVQDLYRAE